MWRYSIWLAMAGLAVSAAAPGVAWSSVPQPRPFAPEAISGGTGVDCLTFAPDGDTAVLDIEGNHSSTIAISRRTGDGWSAPRTAPFSGRWIDHDPAAAPDGSYLIFTSNRPDATGGKSFRGGHLWRVDRAGRSWGAPSRLPDAVNFGQHIYAPSIAANGDVFFISNDNPAHDFHIYRAMWRGGHYLEAAQLSLGPQGAHELDPAVAPDESFIVFDANYAGRSAPDHLYIAFADGDHWSSPVDLGATVDRYQPWGSHLGPDGHTLYFTSNVATGRAAGSANHIWSVDLTAAGVGIPSVFAPGVISGPANDAAATFTPDGKTLYFTRSNTEDYDIMSSHFDGAAWSQPTIAPFSGHWRDLEPTMAPDGSYLIFASSRPIDGSGKPIDGHWGGQAWPARGGHLWRVNRQGDGWSAPVLLPDTVNHWDSTFSPAIAADGSLYFMAATGPGGHFQLYCSRFKDGSYQTPELLPFSAGQYGGVDPAVAPDQSFIVFGSNRPPTPARQSYAFIAFRTHGSWGEPIPLAPAVNSLGGLIELRLGPDGHTLYLTSNHVVAPEYPKTRASSGHGLQQMQSWNDGNDNIWQVDLAPWIERVHGH